MREAFPSRAPGIIIAFLHRPTRGTHHALREARPGPSLSRRRRLARRRRQLGALPRAQRHRRRRRQGRPRQVGRQGRAVEGPAARRGQLVARRLGRPRLRPVGRRRRQGALPALPRHRRQGGLEEDAARRQGAQARQEFLRLVHAGDGRRARLRLLLGRRVGGALRLRLQGQRGLEVRRRQVRQRPRRRRLAHRPRRQGDPPERPRRRRLGPRRGRQIRQEGVGDEARPLRKPGLLLDPVRHAAQGRLGAGRRQHDGRDRLQPRGRCWPTTA
jgi:hypothetical protein